MGDRVCLYALVAGAERPLRAVGIGGEPLRVVRIQGIDSVVGILPRAPKPTIAAMRRYDKVERTLMTSYASVLPARFATCAATTDVLALSVGDRRAAIRRNLVLVRRRVQMTVRLFSGPKPRGTRARTASPDADPTSRGANYLRTRMEDMQVPGADRLRPAVARWVRAERSERHSGGQLAGTLYHLVPRSAVSAYHRALSNAAVDAGLATVVTGPWPPYAFAE